MAQMSNATFQRRLAEILTDGLHTAGIRAKIEIEPRRGTNLCHVWVISKDRDRLGPFEWDALLWRLIRAEFGSDADFRITTIYTVTPAELRRYRANEAAETARA